MFKNFGEETTKYIDEKKLLEAKINDKYTLFSKKINIGDIINVRGKGKFIVGEINHITKSEKFVVDMKKPV